MAVQKLFFALAARGWVGGYMLSSTRQVGAAAAPDPADRTDGRHSFLQAHLSGAVPDRDRLDLTVHRGGGAVNLFAKNACESQASPARVHLFLDNSPSMVFVKLQEAGGNQNAVFSRLTVAKAAYQKLYTTKLKSLISAQSSSPSGGFASSSSAASTSSASAGAKDGGKQAKNSDLNVLVHLIGGRTAEEVSQPRENLARELVEKGYESAPAASRVASGTGNTSGNAFENSELEREWRGNGGGTYLWRYVLEQMTLQLSMTAATTTGADKNCGQFVRDAGNKENKGARETPVSETEREQPTAGTAAGTGGNMLASWYGYAVARVMKGRSRDEETTEKEEKLPVIDLVIITDGEDNQSFGEGTSSPDDDDWQNPRGFRPLLKELAKLRPAHRFRFSVLLIDDAEVKTGVAGDDAGAQAAGGVSAGGTQPGADATRAAYRELAEGSGGWFLPIGTVAEARNEFGDAALYAAASGAEQKQADDLAAGRNTFLRSRESSPSGRANGVGAVADYTHLRRGDYGVQAVAAESWTCAIMPPSPPRAMAMMAVAPRSSSPVRMMAEAPRSPSPVRMMAEAPRSSSPVRMIAEAPRSSSPVRMIAEAPRSLSPVRMIAEAPRSPSPMRMMAEAPRSSSPVRMMAEAPRSLSPPTRFEAPRGRSEMAMPTGMHGQSRSSSTELRNVMQLAMPTETWSGASTMRAEARSPSPEECCASEASSGSGIATPPADSAAWGSMFRAFDADAVRGQLFGVRSISSTEAPRSRSPVAEQVCTNVHNFIGETRNDGAIPMPSRMLPSVGSRSPRVCAEVPRCETELTRSTSCIASADGTPRRAIAASANAISALSVPAETRVSAGLPCLPMAEHEPAGTRSRSPIRRSSSFLGGIPRSAANSSLERSRHFSWSIEQFSRSEPAVPLTIGEPSSFASTLLPLSASSTSATEAEPKVLIFHFGEERSVVGCTTAEGEAQPMADAESSTRRTGVTSQLPESIVDAAMRWKARAPPGRHGGSRSSVFDASPREISPEQREQFRRYNVLTERDLVKQTWSGYLGSPVTGFEQEALLRRTRNLVANRIDSADQVWVLFSSGGGRGSCAATVEGEGGEQGGENASARDDPSNYYSDLVAAVGREVAHGFFQKKVAVYVGLLHQLEEDRTAADADSSSRVRQMYASANAFLQPILGSDPQVPAVQRENGPECSEEVLAKSWLAPYVTAPSRRSGLFGLPPTVLVESAGRRLVIDPARFVSSQSIQAARDADVFFLTKEWLAGKDSVEEDFSA